MKLKIVMKLKTIKIILIAAGIILFFLFIGFSYLVAKETFAQLDFDLTVKFQDKIPIRLSLPFSWFSVLGSYQVTGVIWFIILILMLVKRFWVTALSLFLLPLALAIEVFGKVFVHHPAPPYLFYRGALEVTLPLDFVHDLYSYPSGHETRSAFLIVFLMSYFAFRKNFGFQIIAQPILLGILIIMTVSRIYLGEHWTTDVVGGFLIGASFGLLSGVTIPFKKLSKSEEKLTSS
jgi:membrane-associated phospholipid phosphatase